VVVLKQEGCGRHRDQQCTRIGSHNLVLGPNNAYNGSGGIVWL
jgi:hypothetical protein